MARMKKAHALKLLGGSVADAAAAIGVSSSAVSQWPDVLPDRIADRVLAALARKHLPPEVIGTEDSAAPAAATDSTEAAYAG
jgi:DNA-binding transcriptional regulator YdaS (Cro superfamily)